MSPSSLGTPGRTPATHGRVSGGSGRGARPMGGRPVKIDLTGLARGGSADPFAPLGGEGAGTGTAAGLGELVDRGATEEAVLRRDRVDLGLPAAAGVGFVTGGQAANTTCLAAARNAGAAPDDQRLHNLQQQLVAAQETAEIAQARLDELQDSVPRLDEERRQAQQAVNSESARQADLSARLDALRALQDKLKTDGGADLVNRSIRDLKGKLN